jgi:hypothetical protein
MKRTLPAAGLFFALSCALCGWAFAGANLEHKIAVHVVPGNHYHQHL